MDANIHLIEISRTQNAKIKDTGSERGQGGWKTLGVCCKTQAQAGLGPAKVI